MQTLTGIRNRTDKPQVLVHNGEEVSFEPKEVRIIDSVMAAHAATRHHVSHAVGKDGKLLQTLQAVRLFEVVPLEEALKVARVAENPSIVEARKREADKTAEKKAMTQEVIAELKAQGWQPPKSGAEGGRKP